jgi:hypothetical protein
MGQFGSQQGGRLGGDLVDLNSIPETISLPQLEISTATRSFDFGQRGGRRGFLCANRTTYQKRYVWYGQSRNAPGQAAFRKKSRSTPNTEQSRPESTTKSRYRAGGAKEHYNPPHICRCEDLIDHLTFLMESTSIQYSTMKGTECDRCG